MKIFVRFGLATLIALTTTSAYAWFFFIPIPNVAKPPSLNQIIDGLEKAVQTRALASVAEDKTFGSRYWVWGQQTGDITQEEANRSAIQKCEAALRNAKAQIADGRPLYDFGDNKCELHPFTPNEGPKIAEARKKAAEEEAQKLVAIEEAKRVGAAEEAKRAAEEEAKRVAAAEETKRQEELKLKAEARRQAEAKQQEEARQQEEASRKTSRGGIRLASSRTPTTGAIDFNAEARKSARILGCITTSEPKVTGVEGKNIQFLVACDNGSSLNLSCDPSGLCLKK